MEHLKKFFEALNQLEPSSSALIALALIFAILLVV